MIKSYKDNIALSYKIKLTLTLISVAILMGFSWVAFIIKNKIDEI